MDAIVTAEAREQQRLDALASYDVLDTPREQAFDRITRLVTRMLGVSMSTMTMIDGHRQWIKSQHGAEVGEAARETSFCHYTIQQGTPLVVPDTLNDARFKDNIFVTGAPRVRCYAAIPLRTPDGHNLGSLCAFDTKPREFTPEQIEMLNDLAGLVMQGLELRRLATIDMLTGVLSRRAFRDQAARAVALALRHRHELACIALDVDHFKAINDAHGHAVGDRVLVEIAACCQGELRGSDIFGRLGGEEFAIVLPHAGKTDALAVAEKLRAAVAREPVDTPAGPIAVTASFGVALFDRLSSDLDTLLERADAAVYSAKGEGRNRCALWQAPEAAQSNLRRRVLKAGRISFHGGRSSVDCTVRSLSDTGAGLDVISTAGIPETFKLRIEADGLSRLCRITEKRERHLEVVFENE